MLKMRELEEQVPYEKQLQDHRHEPVVLMILFTMKAEDMEAFKTAWARDAAFTKAQPGFISAQLHQGIEESTAFLDYAVFENVASLAAMTRQPEFAPLRKLYPDSAVASLHLFRRVAIPGICLGEATSVTTANK
jgi:quinol monooxygenase YgiN